MQTTRDRLYDEIAKCIETIADNETYIESIKNQLRNDSLTEAVLTELRLEIEDVQYENDEYRKDIAMLEEVLLKEENEVEDTRSSDQYEEGYSAWDEVFTGGDY